MLIAYHPEALDALRAPTPDAPWRVLVSGCLAAWPCGVEATDYGLGDVLRELFALPTLRALPFCPEQHALGTPRTMPDIHGGDGVDVVAGRARVFDERGADLTEPMLAGARAMVAFALAERVELAIVTDASAACGSAGHLGRVSPRACVQASEGRRRRDGVAPRCGDSRGEPEGSPNDRARPRPPRSHLRCARRAPRSPRAPVDRGAPRAASSARVRSRRRDQPCEDSGAR